MASSVADRAHQVNLGRHAPQPCWHCTQFVGMVYQQTAARCKLPGGSRIRATPERGCSSWSREVGSDDETGPPGGAPTVPQLRDQSAPSTVEWAP